MIYEIASSDWQALELSARVAISATLLSLPIGFIVAYILVYTKVPCKALWDSVINLPLVLPPVVVGYLLLLLLGKHGWLGQLLEQCGIRIIFTWKAAVIASMVVGFPLLVRSIRLGMEQIDPQLIKVARSLGATPFDTLFSIILPLSRRAIFAGATLMFTRSLGEFGATIIIAGNMPGVTQTIPLAIYDYTSTPGGDAMALNLCFISIVFSFAVLWLNEVWLKRSQLEKTS